MSVTHDYFQARAKSRAQIQAAVDAVCDAVSPCALQEAREETQRIKPAPASPTPPAPAQGPGLVDRLRGVLGMGGIGFALALAVLLGGCGGCAGPSDAYLRGDAATFNALAPDYVGLVKASGRPLEEQSRAIRTVKSWRLRLMAAGVTDTARIDGEGE